MSNLTVLGAGYVGLVTAAGLAELGHSVICVDRDEHKIHHLQQRIMPFFEPGLKDLVEKNMNEKRLSFSTDLAKSTSKSSFTFIAINVEPNSKSSKIAHETMLPILKTLFKNASNNHIVILKSTVPPGTAHSLNNWAHNNLQHQKASLNIISNPEFLSEGTAVANFFHPERIVLGGSCEQSLKKAKALYQKIDTTFFLTSSESAELSKYACNAFLATKVSFTNTIAQLCEAYGGTIADVTNIMGSDSRIGEKFLNPGPGYGGSCFPKDVQAIIEFGQTKNIPMDICTAGHAFNKKHKETYIQKLLTHKTLNKNKKQKIAILGSSFKANTDDLRESPIFDFVKHIQDLNHTVAIYDPMLNKTNLPNELKNIECCNEVYEATMKASAIVILTEWDQFKHLNLSKIKAEMTGTLFMDLRNIYSKKELEKHGFEAIVIGS